MSRPTTTFIKRAELLRWLTGVEGMTEGSIKVLLEDGTIPRKFFPGRKRAYYEVQAVANALQLSNPLAPAAK